MSVSHFFELLIQSPPIVIALILAILAVSLPSFITLQLLKRLPKDGAGNDFVLVNRLLDINHEESEKLDELSEDYTALKTYSERHADELKGIKSGIMDLVTAQTKFLASLMEVGQTNRDYYHEELNNMRASILDTIAQERLNNAGLTYPFPEASDPRWKLKLIRSAIPERQIKVYRIPGYDDHYLEGSFHHRAQLAWVIETGIVPGWYPVREEKVSSLDGVLISGWIDRRMVTMDDVPMNGDTGEGHG